MAYDFSDMYALARDPARMAQAVRNKEWADKVAEQVQSANDVAREMAGQQAIQEQAKAIAQQANTAQAQQAQPQPAVATQPATTQQSVALQGTPVPHIQPSQSDNSVLAPMNDTERSLLNQVLQQKVVYDNAQASGDTAGMKRANDTANALRNEGLRYGIDLSRYGADNANTAQTWARLQTDYDRGVGDIAEMPTPNEYYYQRIQDYKAQGYRNSQAQRKAQEDTDLYNEQYKRKVGNAFTRYGINDNGEMNRFGTEIANLMYANNPQSIATYDQYYVNPANIWKFNKNMDVMRERFGQQMKMGDANFKHQMSLLDENGNIDIKKLAMQIKARADEGNAAREFQRWMALNAPHRNSGGGNSGGGSGEKEPSEAQQNYVNNAIDIYNKEKGSLTTVGDSKALLETIRSKVADASVKDYIYAMEMALDARREGVSWNDHGGKGESKHFLQYYDAVANSDYPELVEDLKPIAEKARNSQ